MRALIVGATGFVGQRLAERLGEGDVEVVCLVRSPDSPAAADLREGGYELREGDLADLASLERAVAGIDVVYYLAHMMSGDGDDLVEVEEDAARLLAEAADRAGVERVIYLGGLGDPSVSEHLSARHRTAEVLAAHGPPLTYFRAAMVVGAGSGSFELLRSLVERLPAIASPEWLENRTQPIAVEGIVEFLAQAPGIEATKGREIELGGPETMTYGEMLDGMAAALGKRAPRRLPTPRGIDAAAAGTLAGSISRGDSQVAEHLTAGLATETVVSDPSGMELFEIDLDRYRLALAHAIEDEFRAGEAEDDE